MSQKKLSIRKETVAHLQKQNLARFGGGSFVIKVDTQGLEPAGTEGTCFMACVSDYCPPRQIIIEFSLKSVGVAVEK